MLPKKHNKKGSQSVPPATQGSFSGGARLPNSNVPQNTQSVNNNDMQNKKQDSSLQIDAEKFVQTAFIKIKKGNLAMPTGKQAPIKTPEANNGTVSNKIIFENDHNVKKMYSRQCLNDS